MNVAKAYNLFEEMVQEAAREIRGFTQQEAIHAQLKPDNTLVTGCDLHLDQHLRAIALRNAIPVISEETAADRSTLQTGSFFTIDPIDGTRNYLEHVRIAQERGVDYLASPLSSQLDHALLLGIVENGVARYGCVHNYVTSETIFLDGDNQVNTRIEGPRRRTLHSHTLAEYMKRLQAQNDDYEPIQQGSFGLRSTLTLVNDHTHARTRHSSQKVGIWDILPAATAARAYDGMICDQDLQPVDITSRLMLDAREIIVYR